MTGVHEERRLKALHRLNLLDTGEDTVFDALTDLAASVSDAPMAALSLIDSDRQWFKSRVGLDIDQTPREFAFCHHAIEAAEVFEVADVRADERFSGNPLVQCAPHIRAYVGIPVAEPGGARIGTLCVMDTRPRTFGPAVLERLSALAGMVEDRIASHVAERQLKSSNELLEAIARVQGDYLADVASVQQAFERLLRVILDFTGSEYGFIGDILEDERGRYLSTRVFTDIAWTDEIRSRYAMPEGGGLEFRDPDTLIGHALRTGERVISNEPKHDQRAGGLPSGHPPIHAFAAIPLYSLGELVAMVGIANRPGGFTDSIIQSCDPLLQTIGNLIHARRSAIAHEDALARLASSERRFNLAMDGITAGIWELDLVQGTLFTSDRLLEIIGRRPSQGDALGTYATDGLDLLLSRVHPQDREKVDAGLKRTWATRKPFEMTYRYRHGDGHYLHLFVRGQAEWDENGRAVRMAGSAEDITDRMRLVESEERIRARLGAVTELGGIGSWEVDLATGCSECDGITRRIFGIDDDIEFDLDTALGFFPDCAREQLQEAYRRSAEEGDPWDLELPFDGLDGRQLWVRTVGKPVVERGKAVKLIGSFQDISDRRQREEELATVSNRLSLALETSGVGVWEYRTGPGSFWWDEACTKMFGREGAGDTMTFRSWKNRVHPEDLPKVMTAFDQAIETGQPCNLEYRIVLPGDQVRHIRVNAIARTRLDGMKVISGTNIDITGDVTTAQELDRRREEAEAANAAKSQFLANMSHEIRTPLNGVLGMAQILKMTGLDEKQAGFVETLQSSGRALLALIEDVLDISKIESGMAELSRTAFDLPGMVREVLDVVDPTAREKGIDVALELAPAVPARVVGDEKRMRQVLINIVGNAAKFTETGRVDVRVTRARGNVVRFEVRDTGPGIPEDRLDHVFDRFAQVDDSTTRKHGGTGLGLAICREIVELAGGQIGVDSKPGEGTCFWFEVPMPDAGAAEREAPAETAACLEAPVPRGRILVVDDVETNRVVAAALVGKAGHDVETAANGHEALKALETGHFDAVLMDIQMPVMSGEEAIARIRNSGKPYAHMPVFAVTADATTGARERYLHTGATGYLAKPLDLASIDAALRSVMEWRLRA
jgi:PAS domain S-box-containing protein